MDTLRKHPEPIVRGPSQGGSAALNTVLCAGRPELQARMERALGGCCRFLAAVDGPGALRLARSTAPDVILCEHAPPRLGGLRIVSIVKSDPSLFTIPTVLIWETEAPADIERALDHGADDVLRPSLEPSVLRARIRAAARTRAALRQLVAKHAELVRMNGQLAASRARTRAIIESAHDGILMLLPDGRIESTNPAALRAFALTPEGAPGARTMQELIAPGSRGELAKSLAAASATKLPSATPATAQELTGLRADGGEFPLECRIVPVETPSGRRLCAFLRDLTESKRLLLELQQAQKLESVGRLAAGIAHEINTPIQYIGDNTNFLKTAFDNVARLLNAYQQAADGGRLDDHAAQALASIAVEQDIPFFVEQTPEAIVNTLEGVERVATIVRAMKEFAHPDQKEMTATDLNRAVLATLEVARNEYKYVADVRLELGEIPAVLCHAGEINQVLLNIIVNAAHAIEDVVKQSDGRGEIRIVTRHEAGEVVVAISDTGAGIPEAIREKVFDPFFTTKEVGRGSGQGLSIARSVVRRHQGRISVQSTVGAGTTFEIRLPRDPIPDPE